MNYSLLNFSKKELVESLIYFTIILYSAKFGQYIFFDWNTSPAILWPPTGIALSIIWLRGYKMVVPIFLALVVSYFSGTFYNSLPGAITTPLAEVLGCMVGVYLLRKFNFSGTFNTVRAISVFLLAILFASMVAPAIITTISVSLGKLTTNPYISGSRIWAGYLLSCLIIFPFALTWFKKIPESIPNRNLGEKSFVTFLSIVSVYSLFWRPDLANDFSFLFFASFFVSFFWICLRFSSKILTLSLIFLSLFGILGLFISPAPDRNLNGQLFAAELFLFLVVPIFYWFSALIKERTNNLNKLQELMKKSESENIAKTNFISVLAHELRNPLAPVKTTLEILKLQESDSEKVNLITSAERQIHAMRRLLDDLLDISRVTQGKFSLKLKRSLLSTMLDHSLLSVTAMFKDRNHTIIVDPEFRNPLWLEVDPIRLEQVIVNVLNNAAKYTPAAGIINISLKRKVKEIDIIITDNGIGIENNHLEDIFKSFWQSDNYNQDVNSGIGIGLSLTRYIVEKHGGSIVANSAGIGKGSQFIITLPFDEALQLQSESVVNKELKNISAMKIIIVDDNKPAADTLSTLLRLKGHETNVAYDGVELFNTLKTFMPQVMLLDIGLPGMSGYQIAERLRREGYTGKLVALSGYGQKEDIQKALTSGFDHHITKPMKSESLDDYLRSI